jgi:hypothetical protein
MIRIVVEFVHGGYESGVRELAQADLAERSGASTGIFAQYSIAAREDENRLAGSSPWESRGMLRRYDRREAPGGWLSLPGPGPRGRPRSAATADERHRMSTDFPFPRIAARRTRVGTCRRAGYNCGAG